MSKSKKNKIYYPLCQTYSPTVVLKSISKRWTNMQEACGLSTTPNDPRTISCKAWNSPAEYPSWVARCDIKGFDGNMLNPIFWKKVEGRKHPGRWEIAEHQIRSIEVWFKTDIKSHEHPSIGLLIREQDTIGKPKKTKSGIQPRKHAHLKVQSYRMWWGAASLILNDAPVVCIYTSYNITHIKNAYIHIYKYRASGWEQRSSWGNTPNPQVSAPVPRLVVNGMERTCQRHGSDQTPTLLFESKTHISINSYSIQYAVEEFLLSIIQNSAIVLSLHCNRMFLQQLIDAV